MAVVTVRNAAFASLSSAHSRLHSHACSTLHTHRAVYVQCQAQPSHDGSLILDKEASLYNVIYLSQQNDLLKKTGFHLGNGDPKLAEVDEKPPVLQAKEDCYDGVIVDPCSLPMSPEDFADRLKSSLLHWKYQRKRGVWLQLPSHLADFVPIAVKEGFQFHHAEPSYVMMTYWIPDSPCTLPPNASHQVGIGAFVMNDKKEVLAVQEKNGPLCGSGVWKIPTGLINQGEDLCCGAVREVKEETGVETEFLQVVSFRYHSKHLVYGTCTIGYLVWLQVFVVFEPFDLIDSLVSRHGHHVSFSKSDLYFTCAMRPVSCEIVLQDGEIEAAKWMPLEEFRSQAFFSENKARRKMLDLCIDSYDGTYRGFEATKLHSSSLAQPTQYFFHV